MAFQNMWRELTGTVPNLSPFLAQTYIRRAWVDICNDYGRNWAFKQRTAYITCPPVIQTGTCTVVSQGVSVTADATMKAALDALVLTSPTPPLEGRQFRVSGVNVLLTINAYDTATGVLTLNAPYQGASAAGATYQIYQAYYPPPVSEFQSYLSIEDPNNGYAMTVLHMSKVELDRIDPTRSSQNLAYRQIDYGSDDSGTMLSEFWPHPTQGQTFVCTIRVLSTPLNAPTDTLPAPIPEGLVISRAMSRYAIPWGIANGGRFPALRTVNWATMLRMAEVQFREDIQSVKLVDNARNQGAIRIARKSRRVGGPIDSKFMQSHDAVWYR